MRRRLATPDELERAVRHCGPGRAAIALRRRGLIPPIAGATGLAVDTSTPAFKAGGVSASQIVSNTFSPPASSLLCVIAGAAGQTSATAATITDSLGTHLNWTKIIEVFNGGGGIDSLTLWIADCPSAQTNITATATFNMGTIAATDGTIGVLVFAGAEPVARQLGGTSQQNASALPSMVVNTTAAGSMVIAGWWNWTSSTAATVPAGQTTTFNGNVFTYASTTGSYSWMQAPTSLTPGSGPVTVNDTAPNVQLAGVAMEILAVASPSVPQYRHARMKAILR